MQFHKQNWNQRFQTMGDEAEGIFEQVYKNNWVRTGLNRPPLQMSALSVPVRYMPDYLTSKAWVEVQGCGRDKVIRIKQEKLDSLADWEYLGHPVDMFFWDTTNKRYTQVSLNTVIVACSRLEPKLYPEGKVFYEIPTDVFTWRHHVSSETAVAA